MATWRDAYARKDLTGVMSIVAQDFTYVRRSDRVGYQGERTNYERLFARPGVLLSLDQYTINDAIRLGPADFEFRVSLTMRRIDPVGGGTQTTRFEVSQAEKWRKNGSEWKVYGINVIDSKVTKEAAQDSPHVLETSSSDRAAETAVRAEIGRAAQLSEELIREGLEGNGDSAKLDQYMQFFADSFTDDKGNTKSSFRTSASALFSQVTPTTAVSVSSCTYKATVRSITVRRDGTVEAEVAYNGRVRISRSGRTRTVRFTSSQMQRWAKIGGIYQVTYLETLVSPRWKPD